MKLLRIARAHGLLIVYTSRTYLFDIKQLGLMIFMICFIIFRFSIFFGCSSSFFYNLVFFYFLIEIRFYKFFKENKPVNLKFISGISFTDKKNMFSLFVNVLSYHFHHMEDMWTWG
jgi:hypothetical protein